MENRRVFARQPCQQIVVFQTETESCVGEIQDVGLGGLRARLPRRIFEVGDQIQVAPQNFAPLSYEVRWQKKVGGGVEFGMKYPDSIATFWDSWAADMLAGTEMTNEEVLERRQQVRLDCTLPAAFNYKRRKFKGRVLDLGAGGALIETEHDLKSGTSLRMTLTEPLRLGHLPCKVVRSWEERPDRYGLMFEDLKQRHRLALVRLLDLLMRHKA